MKYVITESQYKLLTEGVLPPALMKLFGAQTAKKMDQIFAQDIANIESFFAKIIASNEKVLLTKAGQQYLRSSIGVDYPASSLKSIIDLANVGKINRTNMEQYLNLLPEKFYNGMEFRENIRKLLEGTVVRVEKGVGKTVAQKAETQVAKTAPSGSFKMGDSEESGNLAYWFDKKFYEANDKRHGFIKDEQINKMTSETKSYILYLLDKIKNIHPNFRNGKFYNPDNNAVMATENELLKMATMNMWGGGGRPGILARKVMYKEPIPSLPVPSQSVRNNLDQIFPSK